MTEQVSLIKKRRGPIVVQIKGWYHILVIGVVMVLVTVGNVAYTLKVDRDRQEAEARARDQVVAAEREADQRWCQLLVPLDNSYQTNPAVQATELGRQVASAIHNIRVEIGC